MNRQQAIGLYATAWAQRDGADIRGALEKCWADAGTYTDPITDQVTGIDDMVELILDFARRYPGAALQPTSGLDLHHNVGRFSWIMTAPEPIVAGEINYGNQFPGIDFVDFAADSRILRIVGFFG
jgi:hypothetical protein